MDIDITRNIKVIEGIKCDILKENAELFRLISTGVNQDKANSIAESIADSILSYYLLGKRLGIEYKDIQQSIDKVIAKNMKENSDIEKYYGDLTKLDDYFKSMIEPKTQEM